MPVTKNNPRKLASGRWQYRYIKPDGSEGSVTKPEQAEAKRAGQKLEQQVDTGEWIDPRLGETPFGEVWPRYLRSKKKLKDRTRDEYDRDHRHWCARPLSEERPFNRPIDDMPIKRIDAELILDLVDLMEDRGLSSSRIHNVCVQIRAAVRFAVDKDWLAKDPLKGLELPNVETDERRPLDHDEVDRLIAAALEVDRGGRWAADVVTGLVETGMRFGEMSGLRVDAVTLNPDAYADPNADHIGDIRVFRQATKAGDTDDSTKRRKFVLIPVSRRLYPVLERCVAGKTPDALVFTRPDGGRVWNTGFHPIFKAMLTVAHIDQRVRLHDLRHTFGTNMANTPGVPLHWVAELMGHTSINTTKRYVHTTPEHLASAMARGERHRQEQAERARERGGNTIAEVVQL